MPVYLRDGSAQTILHAAVCWLVGWLTSQQHASVSQGRICTDNFTCCSLLVGWLVNVPATCQCISGTDLHRQFYMLQFVGWLTSQQHASVSQGRICTDNFTCCSLLVGWLTSQQHASVSQGRICTDNFTCCSLLVGWLVNVPATCQCISGTDLHRQFYMLQFVCLLLA